jgi:hypothetical protein
MPEAAPETAYYLNLKARVVALIMEGVRFPAGRWIRVADGAALAWLVEEMLGDIFPALKGHLITFATLSSEFDVKELERSFHDLLE